jgi:hypothetical protein
MKIFRLVVVLLMAGFVLMMPIFWRAISPTSQPLLDCTAQAATETSSHSAQARCGLGNKWEVSEGCWRGIYVRRGNSNVFDAEWTLLDGRKFTAEVTISIQGNRVYVQRRNATLGGDCEVVNGTLSADGVIVTGVSDCNHPEGRASSCFFARIGCDGTYSSPESPALGTWRGTYQNSKNQSGIAYISFTKGADGKITGIEDGAPIEDVTVTGNVVTFKYKLNGCRTVTGRLIINTDGKTASGSYTVTECDNTGRYTGNYIDYKKQ